MARRSSAFNKKSLVNKYQRLVEEKMQISYLPEPRRMDAGKVLLVLFACAPRGSRAAVGNDVVIILIIDEFFIVVAHFCRVGLERRVNQRLAKIETRLKGQG